MNVIANNTTITKIIANGVEITDFVINGVPYSFNEQVTYTLTWNSTQTETVSAAYQSGYYNHHYTQDFDIVVPSWANYMSVHMVNRPSINHDSIVIPSWSGTLKQIFLNNNSCDPLDTKISKTKYNDNCPSIVQARGYKLRITALIYNTNGRKNGNLSYSFQVTFYQN